MTEHPAGLTARPRDARVDAILKLAVMAVGGQGGGVLTGWIENVARRGGYAVQSTSVAGVAQRTGATIYYIEMAPASDGPDPVFSLMPAAGDVDILVAAEMMEAGRGIMRGFVTPDRTTLIASSHRALAVSEKTVPGDGIADAGEVRSAAESAAARAIIFDMERIAVEAGSVISASLFGALAGSGALPFARESFEESIRASGRGVEASLRAFARGFDAARGAAPTGTPASAAPDAARPAGPDALLREFEPLTAEVAAMPEPVRAYAEPGLRKVVDFQDLAYGRAYLDRLGAVLAADDPARDHALGAAAAKYIANAMAYDDVIRVADLKTRGSRFERVRGEVGVEDDQVLRLTEFMHPRGEEICGLLPARLGARIAASPRAMRIVDRLFNRGRRLRTDGLWAFTQLYILGGLRGWRRRTLRHRVETEHLEDWLRTAMAYRAQDYDLAVEVLRCRRLIKGYSDTHARGMSKYDRVLEGIAQVAGRADAADWARRLREAALQDPQGEALDGALATIGSFAPAPRGGLDGPAQPR